LGGELAVEHLELYTTYHVFVEEDIVVVNVIQLHVVCERITFVCSELRQVCMVYLGSTVPTCSSHGSVSISLDFQVMLSTHYVK
jgi:hypothetical protein